MFGRIAIVLALFAAFPAQALDARANVEKAIELIESGTHGLARSYLEPALIDPRLSPGERSRAYYLRGFSFAVEGLVVSARKDFNRALEFNPENPAVLFWLGRLHYFGQGTDEDQALGVSLFERAAVLGHVQAKYQLAYAYLKGEGVEQDVAHAQSILEENAAEGDTPSMIQLAMSYREPLTTPAQPEVAREWYQKAIDAGDATGYLYLGFMHGNGEFGEADPARGIELYRSAADAGISQAFIPLGHAHMAGVGVAQDYALARRWYEKAVEAQVPGGFVRLGHMYHAGVGVAEDLDKARSLYRAGARLGDLDAQLSLSYLLLGEETPEATENAMDWLRKAVSQGSARAHNDYAWLLATSKLDGLRNGTLAVHHAQEAVKLETNPAYLDTLAAAYAENGQFSDAIETQLEAIKLLAEDQTDLRRELEEHLDRYRSSEPWRE